MRCRGQRKGCTRATEDASFERHAPERLFVYGIIFGDSRGGCCACCGPWAKTTNPKALAGVKRAGDPGTDQCYDEASTATVNHGRHRKEAAEGEAPLKATRRDGAKGWLRFCAAHKGTSPSARHGISEVGPLLRSLLDFDSCSHLPKSFWNHHADTIGPGVNCHPLYVVGESRAPLFVTL